MLNYVTFIAIYDGVPGYQTVGEEYVNIIMVDGSRRSLPSKLVCILHDIVNHHHETPLKAIMHKGKELCKFSSIHPSHDQSFDIIY